MLRALYSGTVVVDANVTDGVQAEIIAAIVIRGSAIGAIRFFIVNSGARDRAEDAMLANDIAHRAALAIDSARSRAEAVASGHSRDLSWPCRRTR